MKNLWAEGYFDRCQFETLTTWCICTHISKCTYGVRELNKQKKRFQCEHLSIILDLDNAFCKPGAFRAWGHLALKVRVNQLPVYTVPPLFNNYAEGFNHALRYLQWTASLYSTSPSAKNTAPFAKKKTWLSKTVEYSD